MIGSRNEAVEIAAWEFEYDDHLDPVPPEGWEYIGDGAYRIAFLSPSGVVYKRENEDGEYWGHNSIEHDNAQRLVKVPCPGWRVPKTSIYKVDGKTVIAMEYVRGEQDTVCYMSFTSNIIPRQCTCGTPNGKCTADIWDVAKKSWGISDIHSGNIVIEEDGTRVLIDVADSSESSYE